MARVGMLHPVFAPIQSETNGTITYGAGVVMGRGVSGNLSWQREDGMLYGDDAVAETDNGITGYTLDVTTTEMTEEVEKVVLGLEEDGEDEYWDTGDPGPYGGHGYVQVIKRFGVMLYRALWYPKISFGVQNEETQTKGQNTTWGTPAVHGLGMAVYNNATGKNRFRKKKLFTGAAAAIAYLDNLANITASVSAPETTDSEPASNGSPAAG